MILTLICTLVKVISAKVSSTPPTQRRVRKRGCGGSGKVSRRVIEVSMTEVARAVRAGEVTREAVLRETWTLGPVVPPEGVAVEVLRGRRAS